MTTATTAAVPEGNQSISPLGPVMMDLAGLELSAEERERLQHPLVGGVILFARNFESPEQLARLTASVRAVRRLPITVDHEGGRVQRFRTGFTRLPPMRRLGEYWDRDPQGAIDAARGLGFVLAAELRVHGVDLSFTPVLDLDYGRSGVIGDRSFHRRPQAVVALAGALIDGLHAAGMGACGKHFPGHGWVEADSHVAIPIDDRPLAELLEDMQPFRQLPLDGVMPAHVIYPKVDPRPAGFSPIWIGKLRTELGFEGVVFSDDLSMEGASVAGDIVARAEAAWGAGCDMLLVCNAPAAVDRVLDGFRGVPEPARAARVARLQPAHPLPGGPELAESAAYCRAREACACLLG